MVSVTQDSVNLNISAENQLNFTEFVDLVFPRCSEQHEAKPDVQTVFSGLKCSWFIFNSAAEKLLQERLQTPHSTLNSRHEGRA